MGSGQGPGAKGQAAGRNVSVPFGTRPLLDETAEELVRPARCGYDSP